MNIVDQIEALLARGATHALTLWPERQFPILNLDKRVENRTWAPPRSLVGPVCAEDPWYVGECGWRFELVDALETPIQCKGAQGLWPLRSLLGHDVGEARAGAVWGYAPRRAT